MNGAIWVDVASNTNNGTMQFSESILQFRQNGAWESLAWTGSAGGEITRESNVQITGALDVTGTGSFAHVEKLTTTFKIPHPDPELTEDKFLVHSAVETPIGGHNIYRYTVNVKAKKSLFKLPSYFKYLNEKSQAWISPANMLLSLCTAQVSEDMKNVEILVDKLGTYNILVIGTRKDEFAKRVWNGAEIDRRYN